MAVLGGAPSGGPLSKRPPLLDPWENSPNITGPGMFLHCPWDQVSLPQPREREGPRPGNHTPPYLDRLGACDDDGGFVEDIDAHNRSVLLSPGNQSDQKEAVNYLRCAPHQPQPSGSPTARGNRSIPSQRVLSTEHKKNPVLGVWRPGGEALLLPNHC